jgi:hypothetical protein
VNARPMPSSLSPLDRLLYAHEHATGHRERRSGNSVRITCAACGSNAYKVAATEAANGSALLHAFCGHTPHEVLAPLGLTVSDLFQRRDLRTMTPAERSQMRQASLVTRWRAALELLNHEATVLLIAAGKMADGDLLDDEELKRMRVAAVKIRDGSEVLNAR